MQTALAWNSHTQRVKAWSHVIIRYVVIKPALVHCSKALQCMAVDKGVLGGAEAPPNILVHVTGSLGQAPHQCSNTHQLVLRSQTLSGDYSSIYAITNGHAAIPRI